MRLFVIFTLTFLFSNFSHAFDGSELTGDLMSRVERGCAKLADKQAEKVAKEYFNMNIWAGGNVGAGSALVIQEEAESYKTFAKSQCVNMVVEVLEMKVGYGPWQN